jgi:DHA3 family macrolide efflux protein-like MFS transporter
VPLFSTPSTVLLQEKVEEGFLGRVFGIQVMISTSMMPLGMLVFGPMADVIAIESMLIVTGVLLFAQGFLMLRSKTMLAAGEPASTPLPD